MTTADDYVIQFIQDKGLVSLADVTEARAAIEPVPDGQNADTLAIAKLVETNKVAWTKITSALSQEFDMEIVDVAQVTPSDDILKLISREQAEKRCSSCTGFTDQLKCEQRHLPPVTLWDPIRNQSAVELSNT